MPVLDKLDSDKSVSDKLDSDKSVSDELDSDKPVSEKPVLDKLDSDKLDLANLDSESIENIFQSPDGPSSTSANESFQILEINEIVECPNVISVDCNQSEEVEAKSNGLHSSSTQADVLEKGVKQEESPVKANEEQSGLSDKSNPTLVEELVLCSLPKNSKSDARSNAVKIEEDLPCIDATVMKWTAEAPGSPLITSSCSSSPLRMERKDGASPAVSPISGILKRRLAGKTESPSPNKVILVVWMRATRTLYSAA